MTFSIFSFCGVFTVFALLMYMGKAEIVAKLANKEIKPEDISNDDKATVGCSAVFAYGWFLFGLFTSSWFICLIWLVFGLIEAAIKEIFKVHRTPTLTIVSALIDAFVVIFVMINELWLHIDVYHWFIGLF